MLIFLLFTLPQGRNSGTYMKCGCVAIERQNGISKYSDACLRLESVLELQR
jgi:hypothetical protein